MTKTFMATGNMTLKNVTFYIDAKDQEEANDKLQAGQFDDWDTEMASPTGWLIDQSSIESIEIENAA